MEVTITPSALGGSVRAINSKSHAHRLLICGALSQSPSFVACENTSEDIEVTARCLCALGASIDYADGGFKISPVKEIPENPFLDCGESGSTLRFLLPVACALGANAQFYMAGRLPERPIAPLTNQLEAHGCRIGRASHRILKASGRLQSGSYTIPGNISSQFISGLLFALPMTADGGEISVTGKLESSGYINMTLDALKLSGIRTDAVPGGYRVPGRQRYSLPEHTGTEGDWSNTAFWLVTGAISENSITCTGLNHLSSQKDRRIVRLMRRFGAQVSTTPGTVRSEKRDMHSIEINAGEIPDLVPILAVAAAAARGTTKITHASRLRAKESDRLKSVTALISGLGGDIRETKDGLIINGTGELQGGTVDSFGDHRIAMAAACASVICRAAVTIKGAQAVRKSYPGFWDDFQALGGKITAEEDI
jgi:3-phosphoshikimate 1-carboxyvinyltransferase